MAQLSVIITVAVEPPLEGDNAHAAGQRVLPNSWGRGTGLPPRPAATTASSQG
jgi:hypothetical protein